MKEIAEPCATIRRRANVGNKKAASSARRCDYSVEEGAGDTRPVSV
ncbi:MAG: hypothetical protein HDQ99_20995 [Lachnospiraceae bacterium]|nr:hypothetical protein [Lachnospiraceae bacterium]